MRRNEREQVPSSGGGAVQLAFVRTTDGKSDHAHGKKTQIHPQRRLLSVAVTHVSQRLHMAEADLGAVPFPACLRSKETT